ncbi:type II CAAX prenyl endopeptidase Rce1 family protein [Arthrobacter sp. NPDC092385]|uniref:CPBP family glutamic-type intramembrane protease n=1 Tax=Arthrobacter sp. NPDC092385 TaxID=3363943 RepID=UPI0038167F4C
MNMARGISGAGSMTTSRRPALRPWWFLAITLGWSWTFWWFAAWSGGSWADPLPFALFVLGGSGPLLSAALLLRVAGRGQTERDFWRRVFDVRRVRPHWWVLVAVVALLPSVLGRAVMGGEGPWLAPGAALVLVTAVVAGVLEEPGWRGYALDALSDRHGAVAAAAIVGAVWALWHLPLFFLVGSYQHGLGRWSTGFWLFMVVLLALSFVYAAVYFATGRSILAVVVLHAAANAAGELVSVSGQRSAEALVTLAMAAVAILLLPRQVRRGRTPMSGRPSR